MHPVSSNQIVDILHFNDNGKYWFGLKNLLVSGEGSIK